MWLRQRAEEVRQRLPGVQAGQIHLGREQLGLLLDPDSDGEIPDEPGEQQQRALQAVDVFDPVHHRVVNQPGICASSGSTCRIRAGARSG